MQQIAMVYRNSVIGSLFEETNEKMLGVHMCSFSLIFFLIGLNDQVTSVNKINN